MATNVTEKDKTLNEIIDLCVEKRVHYRQFLNDFILTHSEDWHDSADVTYGERIMFLRGKIQAFDGMRCMLRVHARLFRLHAQ